VQLYQRDSFTVLNVHGLQVDFGRLEPAPVTFEQARTSVDPIYMLRKFLAVTKLGFAIRARNFTLTRHIRKGTTSLHLS
jgi:hypothetical protein